MLKYPSVRHWLFASSDGADSLQSYNLVLISYLYVDGMYMAKAQHLSMGNYANHVQLNENIPLMEALAGNRCATLLVAPST